MFKSIRTKLTLTYSLLIVLIILIFGSFVYYAAENYFLADKRKTLTSEAKLVASTVEPFLAAKSVSSDITLINRRLAEQMGERVLIVNKDKTVIADSATTGSLVGKKLEQSLVDTARTGSVGDNVITDPEQGTRIMYLAFPVASEKKEILGVVFFSSSLKAIDVTLNNFKIAIWVALLVLLVVAWLVTWALSQRIAKPVQELTAAAEQVASGNLSRRVKIESDDEVGRLAKTFNYMGEHLQESDTLQRNFIADVSHELKTPLTSVRGFIEVLQEGAYKDPKTCLRSLKSVDEEVVRLSHLVNDLLELSKMETADLKLDKKEVDLKKLAQKVIEQFEVISKKTQVGLSLKVEKPVMVSADEQRIKQAMVNLLTNAFSYTTKGGSINLEISQTRDSARVIVRDTGEGIPPDVLPFIFDRFYRADEARSRSTGGTGLGLTITKKIIEAHGGTITVESKEKEGTTFVFSLPRTLA